MNNVGCVSLQKNRKTLTRWLLVAINAKSSILAQEINYIHLQRRKLSPTVSSSVKLEERFNSLLVQQMSVISLFKNCGLRCVASSRSRKKNNNFPARCDLLSLGVPH